MLKRSDLIDKENMRLNDVIKLLKKIRKEYGNLQLAFDFRDNGDLSDSTPESYMAIVRRLRFKDYVIDGNTLFFQNMNIYTEYHDEDGLHIKNIEIH